MAPPDPGGRPALQGGRAGPDRLRHDRPLERHACVHRLGRGGAHRGHHRCGRKPGASRRPFLWRRRRAAGRTRAAGRGSRASRSTSRSRSMCSRPRVRPGTPRSTRSWRSPGASTAPCCAARSGRRPRCFIEHWNGAGAWAAMDPHAQALDGALHPEGVPRIPRHGAGADLGRRLPAVQLSDPADGRRAHLRSGAPHRAPARQGDEAFAAHRVRRRSHGSVHARGGRQRDDRRSPVACRTGHDATADVPSVRLAA